MTTTFLTSDTSDLLVSFAPGADRSAASSSWTWYDITADVRQDAGIQITQGRSDRSGQVPPSQCALTLDNTTGDYSRTNPSGIYFGRLAKNTPLRVRVKPSTPQVTDAFTRSVVDSWGSSTGGGTWSLTGSIGTSADFDVTGTTGTMVVSTAGNYKIAYLADLAYDDTDVYVEVTAPLATGGNLEPANLCLRGLASDGFSYLMCRVEVTTANAVQVKIIQNRYGAETTLASTTTALTHAAATALKVRAQAYANVVRMRVWQGATEPSTWDASTTQSVLNKAGWVGIRSGRASANTNASALFTYDNFAASAWVNRFQGDVREWPPRWDTSRTDRTVPITANGLIRRLQTFSRPLKSPALRAMMSDETAAYRVAYWPLEEESGATSISSPMALSVSPPTRRDTLTLGGGTHPASARMVKFGTGGQLFFKVPVYADGETKVVSLWNFPTTLAGTSTLIRLYATGTIDTWELEYTVGGGLNLKAYSAGTLYDQTGAVSFAVDSSNCLISLELSQSGADVSNRIYVQKGSSIGLQFDDTFVSKTLGRVTHIALAHSDCTDASVGHLGVATSRSLGFWTMIVPTSGSFPTDGFNGEQAAKRITRIIAEENVEGTIDTATTTAMGPQPTKALLDILRECEEVDQGVLFETGAGLKYTAAATRYDLTAALTLDFSTSGIATPEPDDSDQGLVNDVTATRDGGSSFRYEATGANAPDLVGRYDQSVTVNVSTDALLPDQAGWRVNLGTVDDLRWPQISFHPASRTALIPTWLTCDVGSRITVNTVSRLTGAAPDALDLFIEGWTETIKQRQWDVTLNCSPARPWNVLKLDSATGNESRADTGGAELVGAHTSGTTSLKVGTSVGPTWTTTDVPFDVNIAGERVTATAVAATTAATFVAAGATTSSGNTAGLDTLSPAAPAGIAAGDLLVCFASIRNSGTGTVALPANWESLLDFGNISLLAKVYDGSESMPSISYINGVANATVIAQIAAFRNAVPAVASSATSLNASAQDIILPALQVLDANCVVLLLGWKQDDWTSVATVSGFTELGEPASTSGDDAGLVWDYVIQTTAASLGASSFVVTGGASAISRGVAVALRGGTQTFTATRAVNGVTKAQVTGAAVELWKPYVLAK